MYPIYSIYRKNIAGILIVLLGMLLLPFQSAKANRKAGSQIALGHQHSILGHQGSLQLLDTSSGGSFLLLFIEQEEEHSANDRLSVKQDDVIKFLNATHQQGAKRFCSMWEFEPPPANYTTVCLSSVVMLH